MSKLKCLPLIIWFGQSGEPEHTNMQSNNDILHDNWVLMFSTPAEMYITIIQGVNHHFQFNLHWINSFS